MMIPHSIVKMSFALLYTSVYIEHVAAGCLMSRQVKPLKMDGRETAAISFYCRQYTSELQQIYKTTCDTSLLVVGSLVERA